MKKLVFLTVADVCARIESATDKQYVCPIVDEFGFRAWYLESSEDEVRNSPPQVDFTWDEIAEMLGFKHGFYATLACDTGKGTKRRDGCMFEDEVEPKVGDEVAWENPETQVERVGFVIAAVNGEKVTIKSSMMRSSFEREVPITEVRKV